MRYTQDIEAELIGMIIALVAFVMVLVGVGWAIVFAVRWALL